VAEFQDDDLNVFASSGATLPAGGRSGTVENSGARIWYASYGDGRPVILLHGGMGNAGNLAHQVPALLAAGYRAIAIDSRGHGRSTRDAQPFSYELMASDVRAVMDALGITKAAFVGWSDGAATALVLAHDTPERAAGVFFFACNVDPTGTWPFEMTPVIENCVTRHRLDYEALSPTPDAFDALGPALQPMQANQPNYSAADLGAIRVPVTVVQAEHDEFIRPEHAAYIARAIPGAKLVELPAVSHFAPVQRPALFNAAMLDFLARAYPAA
jgi:pimeloyl-ACP methyl ester carboxylesterase